MTTVTRIAIATGGGLDPLESVRRALDFADAMVEAGATVTVTGELSLNVWFEAPKPEPEPELSGTPS